MDDFITVLSTFISGNTLTLTTIVLAYMGGYSAAQINRKNKIADVVMHCMERYDAVAATKAHITNEQEAFFYFRRYFGLKSDQFDYWLSGLVDAENISSWFFSTLRYFEQDRTVKYQKNDEEHRISFVDGWKASVGGHEAQNVAFVRLMEEMQRIALLAISSEEKHDLLLQELVNIEDTHRHYIRFTDVNFIFNSIRSGSMAEFQRMYRKHYRRTVQLHTKEYTPVV